MTTPFRVECGVCGPMVECTDETMMQAFARRHERESGVRHETEVVLG